ncbi:MAG: hypothetical protein K2G06_03860 [Muribaculaceae bacterium]|nr:hypothetical protein [Muribaculaceae bacterium]
MIAAAIILAILVAGGGLIYLLDRGSRRGAGNSEGAPSATADGSDKSDRSDRSDVSGSGDGEGDGVCCGMHITCEKDSLSTAVSTEIIYYDDEELDAYSGRPAESYSGEETEQFRDILLTLLPTDIAGWARSLQLRNIALPPEVSDELLLIVSEARQTAQQ